MNKLSRRDFLRLAYLSMGAATVNQFLTACGQQVPSQLQEQPPQYPTNSDPQLPTSVGTGTQPLDNIVQNTPPGDLPYLVVARNGEPEVLVRHALTALGGMQRFVPKGARVVIKPNICVAYHTYEYAATTNPWVVGALVKLAYEAGAASVSVMDYPFGGSPEEAYARSGIEEQVKVAGGKMESVSRFKFQRTQIPAGLDLQSAEIFKDVLDADVLINVPIAKHHSLARLTLGMKNLMGVIKDRGAIHANLGQRLADLSSCIRPTLTVIDAVRVLMDNGPTGGDLGDVKKMDTLIASSDIVAADSYATQLFGLKPADLNYVQAGVAMGLGRSDLENLHIEEIQVGA